MSLQVWLPLTGDLRNQGLLGDTVITNHGATINNNGKIGQCYAFDNNSSYISIQSNQLFTMLNGSMQPMSFCFWIYHADTTRAIIFGDYSVTGGNNFNIELTTGHVLRWYWGTPDLSISTMNVGLNTWTHVAFTYNGTTLKGYINGQEKYSNNVTLAAKNRTSGEYWLGRDGRTGNTTLNGRLNDFRIYDHALSDKEVEEIAKGLVLHYKLNNDGLGNKNILPISMDLTKWSKESGVSVEQDSNKNMYKIITTGKTSSRWGIYQNITLIANTTYTFSVDGMKVDQACAFGFAEGNAWPGNAGSFTTDRQRLSKTITVGSADAICRIYLNITCINGGTNNAYFALPKLEVGDVATDWSPAAVDGLTTDNIVYDSSGYNNNGIISGTLINKNDSPRYNLSMYFNGSSYVLTSAGNMGWNDLSELTLSCWMCPTASMTGWRGSWGIATDTTYIAKGFAITDYGNEFRVTYTNGSTYVTLASGKTLTQNEWHHCAATLKDATVNMYFDGELVKTYTLNWGTATLNTNARIELGVDLPGSDEKFTGNYSDARLYVTALTAEQVLDLYHTSASIDKEGNVYARELVEE